MTDNLRTDAEALDQRAEWNTPEVTRMSAGSAEADFNVGDDNATQNS